MPKNCMARITYAYCGQMIRPTPEFSAAPAIAIHELAHAIAALEAARRHRQPVMLVSAPGAVRSGGAGWWRELIAQARAQVPDADAASVLDCADEPGMALAAIREGVEAVALDGDTDTLRRVGDIARQSGVALHAPAPADLDLARSENPAGDCENLLETRARGVAKPRALG